MCIRDRHGLLHLHGYIDTEPEERERMFSRQEPLVREFGTVLAGISFPYLLKARFQPPGQQLSGKEMPARTVPNSCLLYTSRCV